MARISSQYHDDFYIRKSDYVIKNDENNSLEDLKIKTKNISKLIKDEYEF